MREFCLLNNVNYQKKIYFYVHTLYSEKQEMQAITKHKVGVGIRAYVFASFLQKFKAGSVVNC